MLSSLGFSTANLYNSEHVIVVGAGLAGIAATCELLELGCSVTLIDKNPRATTGNSNKASTGIFAPRSAHQKEAGINDDFERFCKVQAPRGSYTEFILNNTSDVTWLLDTLKLSEGRDGDFAYTNTLGHTVTRVLSKNETPHMSGQAICANGVILLNLLASHSKKITILRGDEVVKLLTKQLPSGETLVTGVEYQVTGDARSPKTSVSGAVVLCTGGIAGTNCGKWNAVGNTGCAPVCDPRVDGSGIALAEQLGAQTDRMNEFSFTPYSCAYAGEDVQSKDEEKFCLSGALVGPGVAIIDKNSNLIADAAGKPITDLVSANREEICKAMTRDAKAGLGPHRLIIGTVPPGCQTSIDWYVTNNFLQLFSNLENCCTQSGLKLDRVREVLFETMSTAQSKVMKDRCAARVAQGFKDKAHVGWAGMVYTAKITPAVYACCGGLKSDNNGIVQSTTALKGLFVAGEAANGPTGKVYSLAGVPLLHCVVSGRAAARSAAQLFNRKLSDRQHIMTLIRTGLEEEVKAKAAKELAALPKEQNLDDLTKEELINTVKNLRAGGSAAMTDNTKYIALAEVAKHNKKDDAWLVVNGDVIDATAFLPSHPGGEQALCEFLGKDASAEWNIIHAPDTMTAKGIPGGAKILGRLEGSKPVASAAAAPAAAAPAAAPSGMSLDEISKHNKRDDAWLVVNGDVLDVTNFIDKHPGGVAMIMAWIGKDATGEWNTIHRPGLVEKVGLKNGCKVVGKFAGGESQVSLEKPFWDLPPCEEGEPPIFVFNLEWLVPQLGAETARKHPRLDNLLVGCERCGEKFDRCLNRMLECLCRGWIGAIINLLFNFVNNLVRTFLYTGNIKFTNERMGTVRSGLFLVFFVIAHSLDNQVTHLGRAQYNAMTYFMADGIQGEATGGYAWFDMYIGLSVILHASVGLKRSWEINMAYTVGSGRWKWLITGLFILTFLIQHLCDFRFAQNINPTSVKNVEVRLPHSKMVPRFDLSTPPYVFFCAEDGDAGARLVKSRDVYTLETEVFSNPHKVAQYVFFVSAVGLHLMFAWPKVVSHDALHIPKGHQKRVTLIGQLMAVICCLLYVSIPISFYMGIMPTATGAEGDSCGGMAPAHAIAKVVASVNGSTLLL